MSSHLHGPREALKTQCWEQTKTQNESQTLEKDTVKWRHSFQCNIPQCKISFIHMMLNIQGFFFSPSPEKQNMTESTDSRERRKRKKKTTSWLFLPVCTDWNTQSCSYRRRVHKPVHSLMRKQNKKKAKCVRRLRIVQKVVAAFSKIVPDSLFEFSHNGIFGMSRKKVLFLPSPPRWTRPYGSWTSVRGGRFQGQRAHTHARLWVCCKQGANTPAGLMHSQPAVALTAALFWGNESTFDADLQAAFRAKGNFYPSSRPPAGREPIHLADPADSHEVPMEPFFFLLLFFFTDGIDFFLVWSP